MYFTLFVSQMGQPNFESEPILNRCTEFAKFWTDSEEFIDIPFRTVPNFESQFRRPLAVICRMQQ